MNCNEDDQDHEHCEIREHARCVRDIVREELNRAETEAEAQRFRTLRTLGILLAVCAAAVVAERALR